MLKKDFADLRKSVIDRGLCTCCGTCIGVCPASCIDFDMESEEPVLIDSCTACGICHEVCPGAEIPLLQMEREFLGDTRTHQNEFIGVHRQLLKGYARNEEIRRDSASGGATTALLLFALEKGLITGAVVADMDEQKPWRTQPVLARTPEQILSAAKSKYALCPNNLALREVEKGDRLAAVGLPCHVHGVRKIQSGKGLSKLAEQIVFVLGIYCGANTSYRATEHVIGDCTDIPLTDVVGFEYRGGETAQDTKIYTRSGQEITIPNAERMSIFQYLHKDRCGMCCDWTAEVADISLGDIFDPSQRGVWRKVPNWNSLIVRTKAGEDLLKQAIDGGVVALSSLEENTFYGNIGFEIKKHGAVYKLRERKRYGWPTPSYDIDFSWAPRRKETYKVPH
jgi:coenzyme F420 hydrogenase subunit beta